MDIKTLGTYLGMAGLVVALASTASCNAFGGGLEAKIVADKVVSVGELAKGVIQVNADPDLSFQYSSAFALRTEEGRTSVKPLTVVDIGTSPATGESLLGFTFTPDKPGEYLVRVDVYAYPKKSEKESKKTGNAVKITRQVLATETIYAVNPK